MPPDVSLFADKCHFTLVQFWVILQDLHAGGHRGYSVPMRAVWFICMALALGLVACKRENDGFSPKIVVTEPEADQISADHTKRVRGYVVDDHGIERIDVNGFPLFVASQGMSQGAPKIQAFDFQSDVRAGKAAYVIRATDTDGLKSTRVLPIQVDAQKPKLSITQAERRAGVTRIVGVATDNVKVKEVRIDGSPLEIQPSARVEFYFESSQSQASIVVEDAVGNRTQQTIGPLRDVAALSPTDLLDETFGTTSPSTIVIPRTGSPKP
ncbi:MAG: hypothetical protein U0Z75_03655 [Deinococcaceae bacterium]